MTSDGIRGSDTSLHSKVETLHDGDQTHLPIAGVAAGTGTGTGTGHTRGRNKLTLLPLIFVIFFEGAGGPYGAEPAVKAGGPLLAVFGFLIFSFIWAVPECLITAELSAAMPGNGGYVVWVDRAFGPLAGSLMGTSKYVDTAINAAAYPALCCDYLARVVPAVSHGGARVATIIMFNVALTLMSYTGLSVVGWSTVALGLAALSPFLLMVGIALPNVRPRRWGAATTGDTDWKLLLNTLLWNLHGWDSVSTMAGEVERPARTFPVALIWAVCIGSLGYVLPLMAATGAIDALPETWGDGYFADAAGVIAGKWLRYWMEAGAVVCCIGLYSSSISSASYLLAGMADLGQLPSLFGARAPAFDTPWVSITVTGAITLSMSFVSFDDIIELTNVLYSLGVLLEFAAFIWLRAKHPDMSRPYRVPMETGGVAAMCAVPSTFLLLVMAAAGWKACACSAAFTGTSVVVYYIMAFCKAHGCFKFKRQGSRGTEGGELELLVTQKDIHTVL